MNPDLFNKAYTVPKMSQKFDGAEQVQIQPARTGFPGLSEKPVHSPFRDRQASLASIPASSLDKTN